MLERSHGGWWVNVVHACLAVTCHPHFWQNDRDLLRATAVTRGGGVNVVVHACLAVTCHLHFWQNDRDLLRATAVTLGGG